MGTWGSGNFESDDALDYLTALAKSIVQEIEQAMRDPHALEPDEYDGVAVLCRIEILCNLYETINPFSLPGRPVIESWKSLYLSVWDGYIDQLHPKAKYKEKRRATIVETFERLERLSDAK